jgi:hypothetical protein
MSTNKEEKDAHVNLVTDVWKAWVRYTKHQKAIGQEIQRRGIEDMRAARRAYHEAKLKKAAQEAVPGPKPGSQAHR